MNSSDWEKLRKNSVLLQKEIDADELLPPLIQSGVFETGIRSELGHIPTNEKKVASLLEKLKTSPPEKEAYKCFLEALRSCEFDYYCQLATTIEETETESDPAVHAKVDPSHFADRVCQVLNENFTNQSGQVTSLTQIKSVLDENKVFGSTPWSDEYLTDFVCKLFAGVEVRVESGFLTSQKNVLFKHIVKCELKNQKQDTQANQDKTDKDRLVDITSLSPSELRRFLKNEIEKEQVKMSTAALSDIEKQEISGKIFVEMNETQLEKAIPSSTFGLRYSLKNIIESYKQKHSSGKKLERFHSFDSAVKPTDYYLEGSYVHSKTQTRGRKLTPIRNFHQPEDVAGGNDIKHYIIVNCAIFAAACINQRRNGTIHFGISPDETSSQTKGHIVGLHLSPQDLDEEDCLLSLFFPSQRHLISSTVRNAKFIPVVKDGKSSKQTCERYVIEFDIIPKISSKEDKYVKINAKDLPDKWRIDHSQEPVFVFSETGMPILLPPNELCSVPMLPLSTIEQRRQEEHKQLQRPESDCYEQLRNHLTGGSSKMEDDVYKIVLLSSIGRSSIDLKKTDFIQNLQPEVVFDFDPKSYHQGVFKAVEEQEEVLKVLSLDDFDDRNKSKKDMDCLKKELNESSYTHWVFCNGCRDVEQMEAIQWKRKRGLAFRKAFDHYLHNYHKDRLLIILCLFSHNDIYVEACDEVLLQLPRQWILLSGEPSDAEMWQEALKGRNTVSREDLKERCLTGLAWNHVNHVISTLCFNDYSSSEFECQIPDSRGGTVSVEKKKINGWSDIEVLSSADPIFPDDETYRKMQAQVEEEFYLGGQVQWLDFSSHHVCQRKIHEDLFRLVSKSLEKNDAEDENGVSTVYLFHEPGAGGSTSAREILWSLRKSYRCCVMKRFTEQTCNQLKELFKFRDDKPKPLLVLIDSEDEEILTQIRVGIEEYLKSSDICCPTFCVLLICFRTVFVPIEKRRLSMVTLKQNLHIDELSWFEEKYKALTDRYDNPRFLISFNILKTNFNRKYIENTVKEFVKDVKNEHEELILKFVSLINTYDLEFNAIPVACLDVILKTIKAPALKSTFAAVAKGGRETSWEAKVSQSFKVLLNINDQKKKQRKTVRVYSKLTAQQILIVSKAKSGESDSDLILSLLTVEIFENEAQEMKTFQSILAGMIKHRALQKDGVRKEKLSPLILSVMEKEGSAKAKKILETLFHLNRDPYTAQQIARFHMMCKDFASADLYANQAIQIFPWNSALWNTYAQVYKVQLSEKFQTRNVLPLTEDEIHELINLCRKATELFRCEQSKSQLGTDLGPSDETGYMGELESIVLIIKAIRKCRCFETEKTAKEITHKYLISDSYTDKRLEFLTGEERMFLKGLFINSKEAMRVMDDKYLHLKEEIVVKPLSVLMHNSENNKRMIDFKAYLNDFFGEKSTKIPPNFSEEDTCSYRYRAVMWKGANSLLDVLELKRNQKVDELKKCYSLLLDNVKSVHVSVNDLERILDIVTVLLLSNGVIHNLKFPDIIKWTDELYKKSWKKNEKPRLAAFMYFALYNFPTEERLKFTSLAPAPDLEIVLKSWIDAFINSKKKRYSITHRQTTLFFLGHGQPLCDIVYQKAIGPYLNKDSHKSSWDSPLICKILRPMEGTLLAGGDYVMYIYTRDGIDHDIKIRTSKKVTNDVLWRNKIYFYLGFSFSGLKAYGMTNENL